MTAGFFAAGKQPLDLGARLGKGGEGEVYALANRPSQAVKIYTGSDLQDRHEKVRAMVDAGLATRTSLVAFPLEVVTDKRGQFVGFTMNKVIAHKAIHELYAPGARKIEFPSADYRFLVRTATNVARAVAAVHHAGCVIGDINHSGILVSDKATVALIDADSFQVVSGAVHHICRVGVPEYTPPELQGQPLDQVVRTPDHDAFGLAVVIFQLLWMGRHPHSGRYAGGEMPLEKAISENRFAYSEIRKVGMQPPPAAPRLSDFPPQIRAAFEQAFAGPGKRPTARQWVALLEELEGNLRICASVALHHYPRAAGECPWCRMETAFGTQLFIPSLGPGSAAASKPDGPSPDANVLWRTIEAIARPSSELAFPFPTKALPPPSTKASAAHRVFWIRKLGAGLLGLVAGGTFLLDASAWVIWLGSGATGLYFLLSEVNSAAEILRSGTQENARFQEALQDWVDRCATLKFDETKAELQIVKSKLQHLPAEETHLIDEYQRNRQSEQLKSYLQGYRIRNYKIKGMGPSKLAALTSYGIETAFDVAQSRVLGVPGFGPVNTSALVDWRRRVEGRFVYNQNPNQHDQAKLASIKADIARRAAELRAQLAQGPIVLKQIAQQVVTARQSPDARLKELFERRRQAEADAKLLGKKLSPIAVPSPKPRAPKPQAPAANAGPTRANVASSRPFRTANSTPTCPQCGGLMVRRVNRRSRQAFWGCSRYPNCQGTRR